MKNNKRQKCILIIDDDPSILEVMKIILEEEHFKVLTDPQGNFFNKTQKYLPDIVLLDMLLAGSDGKEVCLKIKRDPLTKHIPVLLISANSPREVQKAQEECGADGFITKPFDIYDLITAVKHYLTEL